MNIGKIGTLILKPTGYVCVCEGFEEAATTISAYLCRLCRYLSLRHIFLRGCLYDVMFARLWDRLDARRSTLSSNLAQQSVSATSMRESSVTRRYRWTLFVEFYTHLRTLLNGLQSRRPDNYTITTGYNYDHSRSNP